MSAISFIRDLKQKLTISEARVQKLEAELSLIRRQDIGMSRASSPPVDSVNFERLME